jgi:hypothetical protein
MTRLEQVANVLKDQEWHTSTELVEKTGHRFGACILELRKGKLDGECWVIAGEPVVNEVGTWRYRLCGFAGRYRPNTPTCPKCGYHLRMTDVRKGGTIGTFEGEVTTDKHVDIVAQTHAELDKTRETIEWQGDIIRKQDIELKLLRAKLAKA